MIRDVILRRLRDILREVRGQAPHDRLSGDMNFVNTLGLDSLDVGNFVVEVENTFSVHLGVDGLRDLDTLDKLSNHIERVATVHEARE